jgi:NhaP-type Na+/H+ or K+/H+ antiporter
VGGTVGARASRVQRGLICWFGIRGIGSLYYLTYAIAHDLPRDLAQRLSALTIQPLPFRLWCTAFP